MVKKGTKQLKYENGERILCYHQGLLYEAKCIEIDSVEVKYKVHYQGWNKNWDEWVEEDRLLKYNETNLALQDKLVAEAPKDKTKGKKKKNSLAKQGSSLGDITLGSEKGEKADTATSDSLPGSGDEDSQQGKIEVRPEVKIKLSDEIIDWLVDDESQIKQKRLVTLPAKPCVATILKDFVKYKKTVSKLSPEKELILCEMTLGLIDYFNTMLGSHLLYKIERPQWQSVINSKENNAASIYGITHLLRLLTKIGPMLAYSNIKEDSISSIVVHIHELVRYLTKTGAPLFKVDDIYQVAAPDYIKKAAAL